MNFRTNLVSSSVMILGVQKQLCILVLRLQTVTHCLQIQVRDRMELLHTSCSVAVVEQLHTSASMLEVR